MMTEPVVMNPPRTVTFRRENVKGVWPEIRPLFDRHWAEIAHDKTIPLDPDYDLYLKADEGGMLRVYTAREGATLIGYCVFFVRANPHYKSTIYAVQDIIFIVPE